jgi:hypothetical protein
MSSHPKSGALWMEFNMDVDEVGTLNCMLQNRSITNVKWFTSLTSNPKMKTFHLLVH